MKKTEHNDVKVTSTLLSESERSNLVKVLLKIAPGVTYSGDLTSDVIILVTNPTRSSEWLKSQKFQYVVQYRPEVRLLKYDSILSYYESWLKGDKDTITPDIFDNIDKLRVFEGLRISISRLESKGNDFIQKIKDLVEQHGGSVSESLANNSDVLITIDPAGRRYKKAKEWGIPVVSPDWCFDSVDRGAALGFEYYKLTAKGSKGHKEDACDWNKFTEWKKNQADASMIKKAKENARKNKRMKDEEFDDERELKVAKMDHQDQLWNSIMKIATVNKNHQSQNDNDDGWNDDQEIAADDLQSSNEFNEKGTFMLSTQKQSKEDGNTTEPLLFQGLKFGIYGFSTDEDKILRVVLTDYGAKTIDKSESNEYDYLLVSSAIDSSPNNVYGNLSADRIISEFGIERCIYYHQRKYLDEDRNWITPIYIKPDIGINEFRKLVNLPMTNKKINVAITGFQGIEASHIRKILVKKLSRFILFNEIFKSNSELLIIADIQGTNTRKKIKMASLWKTKMLDLQKFWKILNLITDPGL